MCYLYQDMYNRHKTCEEFQFWRLTIHFQVCLEQLKVQFGCMSYFKGFQKKKLIFNSLNLVPPFIFHIGLFISQGAE